MSIKNPDGDDLRAKLTPLQFEVTQCEGTEPPFANEYWDEHRDGIYVDVVSGEPSSAASTSTTPAQGGRASRGRCATRP